MFEVHDKLVSVEIKSGMTINLKMYQKYASTDHLKSYVIYGGESFENRTDIKVVSWSKASELVSELRSLP